MFTNMNFKRLLLALMLTAAFSSFLPTGVFAQMAFVPVFPGDDNVTEISFNEGQFKGMVSVGNESSSPCADGDSTGYVKMVRAKIWAKGSSPYASNDLSAGPVWPNAGSNFEYTLPVQIPCERDSNGICTGDTIDRQSYNVSCTVYYSNNTDSYLHFKSKSADAEYQSVTPLHFTMTPGYISGTVSISGETLNYGYVTARSANYVDTRIRIGSDGKFCFPVQAPTDDITVSAWVYTTDGVRFSLENQTITDINPGDTKIVNFSVNPDYVQGTVTINNGATLTGGRVYAGNARASLSVSGSQGTFRFPISPHDDVRVTVDNISTSTGNVYNLPSKSVSVTAGTAIANWDFNPQGTVSGDFVLNCLGSNTVDKHWVTVNGGAGWKKTSISGNGPYSLSYLLPGNYSFEHRYDSVHRMPLSFLNNGDDYFHPPYEFYDRSVTAPASGSVTNNVICDAAFVNGKINFLKAVELSVVDIQDAAWANIFGYGVEDSAGGESRDKIDVETGAYDLVVSQGDWRVYRSEFKFDDPEISFNSHDPVYLNSYLYITDHAEKTSDFKKISLDGCQTHNKEIRFMTGAVTFIYQVREGDTLKSPWLKGGTKERASGLVADISNDSKRTKTMGIWNPNRDPSAGEATMVGTPGWYKITAGGILNGVNVCFGAQGEFMEDNARSSKRDNSETRELGVKIVEGKHKEVFIDLYSPTLKIESPTAACRSLMNDFVTVSGTATDDVGGIASITVNDEPADFTFTDNPDDPNEVSFRVQVALDIDTNTVKTVVRDSFGKTASDTRHIYTAGLFTVGSGGVVSTDYLYDGGMYEGELGIFSLSGMENLEPNSGLFAEEAARRALSGTPSGYVILSDAEEGARLSGQLGSGGEVDDWNEGQYNGVRRFRMRPGDKFATIMIPNDTLRAFYEDQHTKDAEKQPLFSLASSNPDFGLYFGQVANISDIGSAFVYEDMSVARSDWDYNDFIVRITGITACSPTLDNPDVGMAYDWRDMELGSALVDHISVSPPDENTLWMSVTLKSPAHLLVYDPEGRFIGKEGGYIPGATFEYDENGHQIVSLPALESGKYRVVLRAIGDGGECHLEVKGYQGADDLLASLEKPFTIGPGEVFSTTLSADAFMENMTVTFDAPQDHPEDFDKNGMVDDSDIETVSSQWNLCEGDSGFDASLDLDNDGCVTVLDIMAVVNKKE